MAVPSPSSRPKAQSAAAHVPPRPRSPALYTILAPPARAPRPPFRRRDGGDARAFDAGYRGHPRPGRRSVPQYHGPPGRGCKEDRGHAHRLTSGAAAPTRPGGGWPALAVLRAWRRGGYVRGCEGEGPLRWQRRPLVPAYGEAPECPFRAAARHAGARLRLAFPKGRLAEDSRRARLLPALFGRRGLHGGPD